jgi:hypothetical protein
MQRKRREAPPPGISPGLKSCASPQYQLRCMDSRMQPSMIYYLSEHRAEFRPRSVPENVIWSYSHAGLRRRAYYSCGARALCRGAGACEHCFQRRRRDLLPGGGTREYLQHAVGGSVRLRHAEHPGAGGAQDGAAPGIEFWRSDGRAHGLLSRVPARVGDAEHLPCLSHQAAVIRARQLSPAAWGDLRYHSLKCRRSLPISK